MRKVRAIAVDGKLPYLLALGNGERALYLDRYEAITGRLERVVLDLSPTPDGVVSLAVGRDGFVLVEYRPGGRRWLVPRSVLDEGDWQEVDLASGRVKGTQSPETVAAK